MMTLKFPPMTTFLGMKRRIKNIQETKVTRGQSLLRSAHGWRRWVWASQHGLEEMITPRGQGSARSLWAQAELGGSRCGCQLWALPSPGCVASGRFLDFSELRHPALVASARCGITGGRRCSSHTRDEIILVLGVVRKLMPSGPRSLVCRLRFASGMFGVLPSSLT